jgi:Urease, gamma subunit
VPEATALVAGAVCEAARDGRRLAEAIEAGRSLHTAGDVLPGVVRAVPEVRVEAVFDIPPAGAVPLGRLHFLSPARKCAKGSGRYLPRRALRKV